MRDGVEVEDRTEWQPITLPGEGDNRRLYVEAVLRGGREEVGTLQAIPFEQITDLLASLTTGIAECLEKTKSKKASVELGVEFGLETGRLVALIARGTGKANLKISLEW